MKRSKFLLLFMFSFVLCVGCTKNDKSDYDSPTNSMPSEAQTPPSLNIDTPEPSTPPNHKIWKIVRELMYEQKYEDAIAFVPQLEKEMAEESNFDKENYLYVFHAVVVYLYLMIGKNEEALQRSDEIFFHKPDAKSGYEFLAIRVGIFMRLNMPDRMIEESNKLLKSPDIHPMIKRAALNALFI